VARTVDQARHTVRRDAFVDAATRLIQLKGYERMSLQDVLDAVEASKGAFYHYFGSKEDLLSAVIDRMVDGSIARIADAASDPDRSAIAKLGALFSDIARYKSERRELIMGFMEVWLSDNNSVVREHFRRGMVGRLQPLLSAIISQGKAEGVFDVEAPDATARVLIGLMQGANEHAGELYLGNMSGLITVEEVERQLNAYGYAFERILGAPPGSVRLADPAVIREWFV
jgi:AcrR family transcriptional regulator